MLHHINHTSLFRRESAIFRKKCKNSTKNKFFYKIFWVYIKIFIKFADVN